MPTQFDLIDGRPFLRRIGIITPLFGPKPVLEPAELLVHKFPLVPPLPLPELMQHLDGEPPPDKAGAQSTSWPYESG
jgi:hypothetical protein